tara:strand:- start:825 stop:1718 length:894 start_codon:yes stop_codon:yes gene_type:complete
MRLLELFSGTHSIGKVAKEMGIEVVSLDRDLGDEDNGYKSPYHIKTDIMDWDYKQFPPHAFDLITASPVCLYWSRLRYTWIGRKCKSIHPTEIITKQHILDEQDKYGKPMVDKVFEIIKYFRPRYWWIENPQTGDMKNYIAETYEEFNKYYDIDYCKYCDWGYQKRTRFWTNIPNFIPKICNKDCENIITITTQEGAKHKGTGKEIQSKTRTMHKSPIGDQNKAKEQKIHRERMGTTKTIMDNGKIIRCNSKALRQKYKDFENLQTKKDKILGSGGTKLERYRIPPKLIKELLECCD